MIFCAFLPFCIQKTSEQNFIKLFRNEDFYGCNITIWNFQKDPSGVLPYALCACTFLLWNVLPDQRQVRFIYQKQCLPPDARQYYIYSRRYAAPHFLLRCCPAWMCIDWIYTELFKRAGCRIQYGCKATCFPKSFICRRTAAAISMPCWVWFLPNTSRLIFFQTAC